MHDEKQATTNPSEHSENLPPACPIKADLKSQLSADNTSNVAVNSTLNSSTNDKEATVKPAKEPTVPTGPPTNYCNRRSWVTTDRMNELRRQAQEAVKQNKTFTIRGCFNSVRNALIARGWVEKLDLHRKQVPSGICQVTYEDLTLGLPKRKPGETRRQYIAKCERNIISRFLEHMPIDFLWTNRKEKCDFIDQAKNPGMTINKFHRAPFTSKEGLCSQLREFHWYYEENTAELYFPRCFNVWSPEELNEFIENFKLTACISFVRFIVNKYRASGFDEIFSPFGKIPFSAIDFAFKRCTDYIDSCQHNDIDVEDSPRIWEHDWDAFLQQQYLMANEDGRILADPHKVVEPVIRAGAQLLENIQHFWPQYSLDGYQNLWIIKPANKCRGRGIQLLDNLKRILTIVNPAIASKSRFVVQKYIERPLIIHNTKFDIRQWFLITNVQPLVVWMYKESYLRFSSQEYSLTNHHESVHLTNHAIQKKYTNGKRDKRLPIENMWDCYSFQAYLRQIGQYKMWMDRIYPGMRKAIVGTMLASQENMDRRPNTFELFGADFMITDDFYPWLIEINSSPDLGATTSVTARMCPQCLEDVVKVVIDRRNDPKSDLGNFELIYRQIVPPTPAYMGLNLFIKGKQLMPKLNYQNSYNYQRRERSLQTSNLFKQRTSLIPAVSNVHRVMPVFNATEFIEKALLSDAQNSSRSSISGTTPISLAQQASLVQPLFSARSKLAQPGTPLLCPNLLKIPLANICILRRSLTTLPKTFTKSDGLENRSVQNQSGLLYSSSKRHRSCGPRLPTGTTDPGSEQNLRCISKKCALQDTSAVTCSKPKPESSPKKTESSKSRNNRHASRLAQLHKSAGTQDRCHNPALRSQSSLTERQHIPTCARKTSGRRLSVNARKKSAAKELTDMENENEKSTMESSAAIHAIGRGLVTWKAARRQTGRNKPPAASENNRTATVIATNASPNSFPNPPKITTSSNNSRKFNERAKLLRNTRC